MKIPGRGASINPRGRFERLEITIDEEFEHEAGRPPTVYYEDDTQTLITTNDSPDIGFRASLNPYRGCEHGCSYCYARPFHEYLGFSAGLEFETRILVKTSAPALLHRELGKPSWKPQPLAMSGVTDCYQPVERRLEITRGCLQVLADYRQPVAIVTKNHLVTRDIDHLSTLASVQAAMVFVSVTTLDASLASRLEPRASLPAHRLDAIRQLHAASIPVGVLMAPIIPGLTDHEIPAVLSAAREAGASTAAFTVIRLPYGVKDIFSAWLDAHLPGSKEKILERIRSLRDGALNDSRFRSRMRGEGFWAEQIHRIFTVTSDRLGFGPGAPLSTAAFRNPSDRQLRLF